MKLNILLAGVSLLASNAWAGNVSNVAGTLDTTIVDPAPAQYPHFICASGCSSGAGAGGAVTQSGAWSVGVSNFPSTQTINGVVTVPGVATSANQPVLNLDGGALSHITNLPSIQSVSGTVTVGNFPATQAINGAVAVPGVATAANQPNLNSDGGALSHVTNLPAIQAVNGTVTVGNLPATQAVTGSVTVLGVATAVNQPSLNADGGALAHIVNFPVTQPISGSVTIANLPATQPVSGSVSVGNFPSTQAVSGAISVSNFPATQAVSGTVSVAGVATAASQPALNADGGALAHIVNFPVTQPVSGSVTIANLPVTQPVSGSISVGNFPSTQAVSGAISVSNFPATQAVSGAVNVAGVATAANQPALNIDGGALAHVMNFPPTQPVSGTVTVSNLPLTQTVTGTLNAVLVDPAPTLYPHFICSSGCSGGGGGGGGGAVTAASGAYVAGSITDLQSLLNKTGALNGDGGGQVHVMNVIAGKQQDSGGGDATDPANHAVRVNVVTGAATGVAQGSTTSGQTGGLMQGAVTTAAPAYTTGQTNPVSLTVAGALRTDGSGVTQPVSNSQEHTDLAALQTAVSATASVKEVDSGGTDATDTVNHAIRQNCVAGCNVASNPRQATASVPINVSATATTQLIAASGTTAIYVSNYSLVASGADNVTLEYGTTCGGTVTALTGAYALAANGGVVAGSGIAPVLIVPAGNALCILHTATTQVGGSVAYAQF